MERESISFNRSDDALSVEETVMIKLQAICGVSTEYPRSTLTAFQAAADQKYNSVYFDVRITGDGQLVAAGEDAVKLQRPKFLGLTAAKVEEVLKLAREENLYVRIGSSWESLQAFAQEPLLQLLESYEGIAMLTCSSVTSVEAIAKRFPQMRLHFCGAVTKETLQLLSEIVTKEKLTIWLSYDETEELSQQVKCVAQLGVEGLCKYEQLDRVNELGADIVSTLGQLKPVQNQGLLSDMHTHSQNSMDANVPIMDLCKGELDAGVKMVAIADHCEMMWLDQNPDRDIHSCFMDCWKEIHEVQQELGETIQILMGMELGQGAWYPEQTKELLSILPYDVIVGAIHGIKDPTVADWKEASTAWQRFFDDASANKLPQLWNQYFEEALTMVETVDIDIVAHLTFIARAAWTRHGLTWDLHPFEGKIRKVLQAMIDRGIALEINIYDAGEYGAFDPQKWIVEMYRDMGGYLITMASDAHTAKHPVAAGFSKNAKALKEMGFRNIFYYKNRRSYPCAL